MLYLGIESSCDETAAAVVETVDGQLLVRSNIVASQIETHRLYGGVVPEIASRAHCEAISRVVREALDGAGVTPRDLTAIGVTAHPGLIGALLVGVSFAKGMAAAHNLPLVPVDHIRAHIAAAYLGEGERPKPPFLAMAASGGHTSLYLCRDYLDFSVIGQTRDDAIGEAYDKIGRIIGIPYPAGAGFDRLAAEGFLKATGKTNAREAYAAFPKCDAMKSGKYNLPSPALTDGTLDFSFSGLKTAAINLLHRFEQTGEEFDRAIFAAAYTHKVTEAVAKQVKEAISRHTGAPKAENGGAGAPLPFVLAGGVAANSHLRMRISDICAARRVPLYIPPLSLCGDNAAMVAAQAHFSYLAGVRAGDDLNPSAADEIV